MIEGNHVLSMRFGESSSHYLRRVSFEFSPDLTIDDLVEEVLKPLLVTIGYHPDNIAEVFGEKGEE